MQINSTKSKKTNLDLSLILPCYNENADLRRNIERVIGVIENMRIKSEIILIDDKSKDNTPKIINEISKNNKNIRSYFHSKNVGRGGTVAEGISRSKGDVVGFIDVDLEVSPFYIPEFYNTIKNNNADVAVANRRYSLGFFHMGHLLRAALSKGYSYLIRKLFNVPIRDTEAGYKFFKREKIMPVLLEAKDKHWFWDTEIIVRSLMHGLNVRELQVDFIRNKEKKSTVRILPDIIAYISAIYKFRNSLNKKRLIRPRNI